MKKWKNNKIVFYIFLVCVSVLVSIYFIRKNKENQYVGDCINYKEKQFFNKPIPVEWTAKFDGCLASCWGGTFTRVPENSKYPRFSGYVPSDGEKIADEYLKEDKMLKITGLWTDVSDSYGSVFDNKCVPTVIIQKIDMVNN